MHIRARAREQVSSVPEVRNAENAARFYFYFIYFFIRFIRVRLEKTSVRVLRHGPNEMKYVNVQRARNR